MSKDDEDSKQFRDRFDDFFASLDEELGVCKQAMGDLYAWLEARVDHLAEGEYKSKKVRAYVDDDELSELLYEDGLVFATEYPVDEDDLADRFKKASTNREVIQRRKTDEDRKKADAGLRAGVSQSTSWKLVHAWPRNRGASSSSRVASVTNMPTRAAGLERRPAVRARDAASAMALAESTTAIGRPASSAAASVSSWARSG